LKCSVHTICLGDLTVRSWRKRDYILITYRLQGLFWVAKTGANHVDTGEGAMNLIAMWATIDLITYDRSGGVRATMASRLKFKFN